MTHQGCILIADDDDTFAEATASRLADLGHRAIRAADADATRRAVNSQTDRVDLLICETRLAGDGDLELVEHLAGLREPVPVVLVAAEPSLESALRAIRLPVVAYLPKPVEFDPLRQAIDDGLGLSRTIRDVHEAQRRLQGYARDLACLRDALQSPTPGPRALARQAFVDCTLRNALGSLEDLHRLSCDQADGDQAASPCHLLNCPRPAVLIEGIRHAIEVLERTKGSFRSKELGRLRAMLSGLVRQAEST